jgi:hypothetical protein
MPRVAGFSVVGVLAAAIAFYAVGMVFYGFVFMETWGQEQLVNHGADAAFAYGLTGDALFAELSKIPGSLDMATAYGLGFVVSLVTTIGIAFVLKMARPASIAAALGTAFILWACFAATGLAYNVLYSTESKTIFVIDLAHLLTAFLLSSGVLFLIDGKALSGVGQAPGSGKQTA